MKTMDRLVETERRRQVCLAGAHVVPDSWRCVQCGICQFNCPVGIDIRSYTWRGEPVDDSRCIRCGECVARCPRGALHFGALYDCS